MKFLNQTFAGSSPDITGPDSKVIQIYDSFSDVLGQRPTVFERTSQLIHSYSSIICKAIPASSDKMQKRAERGISYQNLKSGNCYPATKCFESQRNLSIPF